MFFVTNAKHCLMYFVRVFQLFFSQNQTEKLRTKRLLTMFLLFGIV